MMSLTFGLFTQVSGLGPLGPLVLKLETHFENTCICNAKFGNPDQMPMELGICSESTLLAHRNSYGKYCESEKVNQKPLKLETDSSR